MAKSLTKTHEDLLQERLKIEEQIKKTESKLGEGIVTLIKQHDGFKVPYSVLCGALIETLNKIDNDKAKQQDWQVQGDKFLRSIQPKKSKKDTIKAA